MIQTPNVKPHRQRPAKPWVRQRRLLLAGMVVTLCTLLLLILSFKHFLNATNYQAHVDNLRSRGIPVTTEELQEWHETVIPEDPAPEASNSPDDGARATDLYQQAFEERSRYEMGRFWPEFDGILKSFAQNGVLSPEELEQLRAYVKGNKAVLALLHQARHQPPGKYDLDYSKGAAMELPHLAHTRHALQLLRAEALLATLEGDTDQVHKALMAGLAVMRPLRREPVFVSQLVRSDCINELLESMQDTFGRIFCSRCWRAAFASSRNTEETLTNSAFLYPYFIYEQEEKGDYYADIDARQYPPPFRGPLGGRILGSISLISFQSLTAGRKNPSSGTELKWPHGTQHSCS